MFLPAVSLSVSVRNHTMNTFLSKKNCDCDLAQSRHVQFETDLHQHKDKH